MSIDIEQIEKLFIEQIERNTKYGDVDLNRYSWQEPCGVILSTNQASYLLELINKLQARIKELEFDRLFIKHLRKAGIITSALEIAIFKQIEKENKQ